ncbi:uncharacterized protein N7496_001947 [Penicillium cataractarum]|uniref:Uncharacterized protein n=1 Tax=Penicillium cataractarum TaxID=2100454 RepID=A0A9W9VXB0_9EURO|nr:uncharacterized protein N7496_001947 [Penicillium cataractarum]KAJ5390879.1 hypothetical protein N7496_001947 [Penicillium cataractarum]
MRWNPSADQLLLLKIVETHDISVDTNKVAAAWPSSADGQPGPTPRAIKERLGKLRELARRSGSHVPAGSPGKRGRGKKASSSKSDSDAQASTPRKRKRQSSPKAKEEANVKEESSDDEDDKVKMEQLLDYPAESTHAEDTGHMSHENDEFFDENV